jgi:hypothetical protein
MNFLKNLFGSQGANREEGGGSAMFFYVRPARCDDVVRVRVDLNNDLSLNDDSSGYWIRKVIASSNYKCGRAELTLYFDINRKLLKSEISGGELVNREAYDHWRAGQQRT